MDVGSQFFQIMLSQLSYTNRTIDDLTRLVTTERERNIQSLVESIFFYAIVLTQLLEMLVDMILQLLSLQNTLKMDIFFIKTNIRI